MNGSDRIRSLEPEEMNDLYKKVLFQSCKRHRWIESRLKIEVKDVVQEAFRDIIAGDRNVRPDQPLLNEICLIVRSKVNHAWEAGKRVCEIDDAWVGMSNFSELMDELSRQYPQLQIPAAITERQAIYNEICHRILELVADDDLLTKIVGLWINTPDLWPQDVAQTLGLEITTIRLAQKRLRSRVRTLMEMQTNVQFT